MFQATELVGFGASSGLSYVQFFASANSAVVPAATSAGDLIVYHGFGVSPPPSGYTAIVNSTEYFSGYKISDGSDGGANIDIGGFVVIAVFRGNEFIRNVTVKDTSASQTDGNPSGQTITSASGITPLIVFGCYASDSAVDPRSMTPEKDSEVGGGDPGRWLAWKIYNGGSEDVVIDMDDEGADNSLMGFYLELA
jgi:hypothetical protein